MRALDSLGGSVPLARVMREHRAALLPLGITLAINIIVLLVVVLPLSQRVSTNAQRAENAERQRAVAEAEFKRAEGLRDGKTKAIQDLDTFYKQVLPTNVAAARRVLHLKAQQLARAHSLHFESGDSTEDELDESTLLRLSTQMNLSGEYDDIRGFIYELETAPDFVVIDNVKLAEGSEANAPLSVSLDVSTYYRMSQSSEVRTSGPGR